jgi:soluble lytic murein transglycosylase-like protein
MVPNYNDYSISNLQELANHVAGQYGIPTSIFSAQINQESGWNPSSVGDNGTSFGLGQINVPSHPAFDSQRALYGNGGSPDLAYQLNYQAEYLKGLYDQYGDWPTALARYNGSGPDAQAYSQKVISASGWTP